MEAVSGSAALSALRVSLQVISSHRRPIVEFYYELHNDAAPAVTVSNRISGMATHRCHDIFAAFSVVNIGGIRAENVILSLTGNTGRKYPIGPRIGTEIAQMAPGQSIFLFRIDMHDLFDTDDKNICSFCLRADYDGPWHGINRLLRLHGYLRGKKQYCTEFRFCSDTAAGDLPPVNYA